MNKEIITEYLRKFDYDYSENGNHIIVKQDFNLKIYIDLSDDGKIKIKEKLDTLNFLSWPFSMSIKGTMIYNFISSFIVFVLFLALRNSINNYVLTLVVIFSAFWNLHWLIYYLNKSDSLKREIKNLTK